MLQSPTHIHAPTHKRLLLAFVILKLLVKPLLSEVLTALSALLLPFLPRRGEGLQVDMTSLLPSGSQGRQAVTTHPSHHQEKQHEAPHQQQVDTSQQHAEGLTVGEGQLQLLQTGPSAPVAVGAVRPHPASARQLTPLTK